MTARRLLAVLLFAPSLVLVACGGDDSGDGSTGDGTGAAASGDLEAFCAAADRYATASGDVDVTSVESILDGFEELADLQEELAEHAPEEIEEAQGRLAAGAAALLEALEERDPQSLEEFNALQEELVADLEEEFGTLDAETTEVEAFLEAECGGATIG